MSTKERMFSAYSWLSQPANTGDRGKHGNHAHISNQSSHKCVQVFM
jgi:hypothetical protein